LFGLITKKKLLGILGNLSDSQDEGKAIDVNDFYWRCGNANAINYICSRLGLENPQDAERRAEGRKVSDE
jgi:hypothetical protein